MHCDTLTFCLDRGEDLKNAGGQINLKKLRGAGCALQCFAIFTDGENSAERFESALSLYNRSLSEYGELVLPVFSYADYLKAERSGKIAALLTVENLGFIGNDLNKISLLRQKGVRMCSLVWNNANQFAFPNLICRGVPAFSEREERGLTPFGRQAVEELNRNGIIIDISHLSDGGADDVLRLSDAPVVASHSNCFTIRAVSRNLTDSQIKKISGKGGVLGVNFCKDFVGGGEDIIGAVCAHIKYLINVGGEDCAALGSDFDGISAPKGLENCLKVPLIFERLRKEGVSLRVIEKFAYGNFLRVLREAAG